MSKSDSEDATNAEPGPPRGSAAPPSPPGERSAPTRAGASKGPGTPFKLSESRAVKTTVAGAALWAVVRAFTRWGGSAKKPRDRPSSSTPTEVSRFFSRATFRRRTRLGRAADASPPVGAHVLPSGSLRSPAGPRQPPSAPPQPSLDADTSAVVGQTPSAAAREPAIGRDRSSVEPSPPTDATSDNLSARRGKPRGRSGADRRATRARQASRKERAAYGSRAKD